MLQTVLVTIKLGIGDNNQDLVVVLLDTPKCLAINPSEVRCTMVQGQEEDDRLATPLDPGQGEEGHLGRTVGHSNILPTLIILILQ